METKYSVLNKLNLIDKDDIVLYLSSQEDIIDKIKMKRLFLNSKYRLFTKKSKVLIKYFKWVLFKNKLNDKIVTNRNIERDFVNTETFLGDPIDYIPDEFFYTYKEGGFYYAFDLREFDQLIKYGNKNPYTNNEFPEIVTKQVKRLLFKIKTYDLMIYIKNSIPQHSSSSAKVASVFNKLTRYFVYPDIRKFMDFSVKFYLYYIQDLRTNSLLISDININRYDDLLKCYSDSLGLPETSEHYLKILNKSRNAVLDILLELLDIDDANKWTRALAISEQINYNYDSYLSTSNSDSEENSESENEAPIVPENRIETSNGIILQRNPLFQAAINNYSDDETESDDNNSETQVDSLDIEYTPLPPPRTPPRSPPRPPPSPPETPETSTIVPSPPSRPPPPLPLRIPTSPPVLRRSNAVSNVPVLPPGINRRNSIVRTRLNNSIITTRSINRLNLSSGRSRRIYEFPPVSSNIENPLASITTSLTNQTTPLSTPITNQNVIDGVDTTSINSLLNSTREYLDSIDNNNWNSEVDITDLTNRIETEIRNLENIYNNNNNNEQEN